MAEFDLSNEYRLELKKELEKLQHDQAIFPTEYKQRRIDLLSKRLNP